MKRFNQYPKFNTEKLGIIMLVISWVLALGLVWILYQKLIFTSKPLEITKFGNTTQIKVFKNNDGHYTIDGFINNYKVEFLIDTGASYVSISQSLAIKLGLPTLGETIVDTASGEAVAYRTKIDSFTIGEINFANISATAMPNMHKDFALLGMNVLKHFDIIKKENTLTLSYKKVTVDHLP